MRFFLTVHKKLVSTPTSTQCVARCTCSHAHVRTHLHAHKKMQRVSPDYSIYIYIHTHTTYRYVLGQQVGTPPTTQLQACTLGFMQAACMQMSTESTCMHARRQIHTVCVLHVLQMPVPVFITKGWYSGIVTYICHII